MIQAINKVQEGNVVEVFKLGNTTIKICDDAYRDRTEEDIQRSLEIIAQIAYENFYAHKEA